MKYGLLDVGGGFRGIYAAGVMDRCLDAGIEFDCAVGISAGSANITSFAAKQLGRNFRFYVLYGARPEYASMKNFITKHTFIDMDYVYGTLSNSDGEDPLDYETFAANPMELYIAAADAQTGEPHYFSKDEVTKDHYDALKGSCAIPGVCKPYRIGDRLYFDGAVGDPVPIDKMFELGCDKVVLVLTKPEDFLRTPKSDNKLARLIQRKYPVAANNLRARAGRYNVEVAKAQEYAREGKVLIVAPDDTCGVSTLTREREPLEALYAKGFADGEKIFDFME